MTPAIISSLLLDRPVVIPEIIDVYGLWLSSESEYDIMIDVETR